MKNILVIALCFMSMSFSGWENNFETAKMEAKQNHKCILLNFSGSDWCGPCMRLKKEIFGSEVFKKMADENLVLVNADFPRNKKNQLSKEQQKMNDALADRYNANGSFPLTVLLNTDGQVIKQWDGLPVEKAADFTNDVKAIIDDHK